MSNTTISPDKYQRRSFVYRKLMPNKVTWTKINDFAVTRNLVKPEKEVDYAQNLALCDLCYMQRIGFKGHGATKWLEKQEIHVPNEVNTTHLNSNNCLVARLGADDILILDSLKNSTNIPNALEQQWHQDYSENKSPCGFIMPRQDSHACFSVTGNYAPEMFSKLCAIDLRKKVFKNKTLTQTSLARLGAMIIRNDLNSITNFIILVESASAEYCWDALLDAMREFNGKIIGNYTLKEIT